MQFARDKIVVVVGTVTNDERLLEVPKMKICALKFTTEARERILRAKGEAMTLDQLVLKNPLGTGTALLRPHLHRESMTHWGKPPGLPGSHTRPYARQKGRNHEGPTKDKIW